MGTEEYGETWREDFSSWQERKALENSGWVLWQINLFGVSTSVGRLLLMKVEDAEGELFW